MICPGCGAPAAAHDVLHHFLCAYVGPDYDFFETGKDHFSCPKCRRALLSEGEDWEKIGAQSFLQRLRIGNSVAR